MHIHFIHRSINKMGKKQKKFVICNWLFLETGFLLWRNNVKINGWEDANKTFHHHFVSTTKLAKTIKIHINYKVSALKYHRFSIENAKTNLMFPPLNCEMRNRWMCETMINEMTRRKRNFQTDLVVNSVLIVIKLHCYFVLH